MQEKGNVFYPECQRTHPGCDIAAVKAVLAQEGPEYGSLTASEQPPTSYPCRRVGLDDPQRSLPTPTIL